MKYRTSQKEKIVSEYLMGELSYRNLGLKSGINFRMIHKWVMKYEGKKQKQKLTETVPQEDNIPLSSDVKQLQVELRKAQLHNKLLNAIIDIAEEQLKIDIRKKSGTKR